MAIRKSAVVLVQPERMVAQRDQLKRVSDRATDRVTQLMNRLTYGQAYKLWKTNWDDLRPAATEEANPPKEGPPPCPARSPAASAARSHKKT